jgi:hypothetical protein
MPRAALPPDVVSDLSRLLGGALPAQTVNLWDLTNGGFLPRRFKWDPDICLRHGDTAYLVHAVVSGEIPDWVAKPMRELTGKFRRSKLVIFVRRDRGVPAWRVASTLVDQCVRIKAGLAVEIFDGCCLVFPPGLASPKRHPSNMEAGHIPSWVLDRLLECDGFSPYLTRCLKTFITKYRQGTLRAPSYDEESDLLLSFARSLRRGDPRVYVPLDLLNTLATWERHGQQGSSRDHFFHTFNNLFLGFLILGHLFSDRSSSRPPDRYIRHSSASPKLVPWEVIWTLTCLFHDPGYITEKIWVTISFVTGIPNQLPSDQPIPEQIKEQLNNAWDVDYREIGEDIVSLFRRLRRGEAWAPPRFTKEEAASFDTALRKVYFDGERVGHSLQSGIHLINYCSTDKTPPPDGYDAKIALAACEIAALSMMFHDQHCRNVMREAKVRPLTFEQLPYSVVLMFVDALQDDRRDIKKNQFPTHGVLVDMDIRREGDHDIVKATVCLPELPLSWWPSKIEEYEDVLRWINSQSKTEFVIDYQERAWKMQRTRHRPRKRRRQ